MLAIPTLLDPEWANTSVTAAAASPVSPKRRMTASDTAVSLPRGKNADTTMSSGMSAVNACEAMTIDRSRPRSQMNDPTHRPGKLPCARSTSAGQSRRLATVSPVLPRG